MTLYVQAPRRANGHGEGVQTSWRRAPSVSLGRRERKHVAHVAGQCDQPWHADGAYEGVSKQRSDGIGPKGHRKLLPADLAKLHNFQRESLNVL